MPRKLRAFVVLLLALQVSSASAAELIVSAAASLTNALRDVSQVFEQRNPGHKVLLNFASSDVLLSQIAKGAPVDVFATADVETMDRAEKQDLLAPGTRRILLRNALVLIAPAGSPMRLTGVAGLEDPAVRRIAIGNPASVPAGRYARAALDKAGMWGRIGPKLILAQNVRQALDYVARGEVDAGLVYATDAAIMASKVRVAATVPTTTPIAYPVALVKDTRNRALAESFLALLESAPAQAVFSKYGFSRP
jgi:molybdate transport system substrate-binding protein